MKIEMSIKTPTVPETMEVDMKTANNEPVLVPIQSLTHKQLSGIGDQFKKDLLMKARDQRAADKSSTVDTDAQ